VKRREFITLVGGAAATWPLTARAQQSAMPVIGLLSPFSRSDTEPWHRAFVQGLRKLGWVEGENIKIEYRYAEGRTERLPELVADLISHQVAVIVTAVTPDTQAAARATKTIPIVMASAGDPIATGLVQNLARPGGNITGLSQMVIDIAAKRLEMLKEIVPGLSRVAVLWNPRDTSSTLTWREIQLPAQRLDIELQSLEVKDIEDFDGAFATAIAAQVGAVYPLPGPIFVDNERRIAEFAARNRLLSIFHLPEFVRLGGLMAYGPDRVDMFRRAAAYVDKILKGAHPGDLPIEQPTKFELALNLKTAKALGLTIPPLLLVRADEVIE
jgi:putative ABC transport system substrate-binding protein